MDKISLNFLCRFIFSIKSLKAVKAITKNIKELKPHTQTLF